MDDWEEEEEKGAREGNHVDRHTLGCIKYNPGAEL